MLLLVLQVWVAALAVSATGLTVLVLGQVLVRAAQDLLVRLGAGADAPAAVRRPA